jgi:DNA-binding CsgD family transcriptional regulator
MLALFDSALPNASSLARSPPHCAFHSSLNIDQAADWRSMVDPAFFFAAETLARLGSPALVFDAARRVLVANYLIDTLPAFIRLRAQNVLSFCDPLAEALFRKAAADLDNDGESSVRPFAARCSAGAATAIARILPIRPTPGTVTAPNAAMLIFVPLIPGSGPSVALLQSLFDLTPAEARVARGLASGATVNELACAARVSRNTVRSQLRGILEKTGCHRQSEAVSLFCRVGIAGCPDEQIEVA